MFGGGLQDEMLKAYIDKIFDQYDKDKSGSLDQEEMASFFNALFSQLGIQQNVTREQSLEAIRAIDNNSDGRIDKNELFLAFKAMLSKAQMSQQPPPPQYNYPYGGYPPPPYNAYPNYPQYPQGYGGYGGYPPPQPQGYPQSPFYSQYPPNQNQMYGSQGPYGSNHGQFGNPGMSASYQGGYGYGYGSNYPNQYKK